MVNLHARLTIAFFASIFLLGLAQPCFAIQQGAPSKKRVLLLYSHHALAPINAEWNRGIRTALADRQTDGVNTDVEYLDLDHNTSEEYRQEWLALLKRKYSDRPPDLIIPIFNLAFHFAMEHRDELFPNIPIVYCSVDRQLAESALGTPGITGVVFQFRLVETVDVARELFPNTNQLLVVTGASKDNKMMGQMARNIFADYDSELKIDYIDDLMLPQLLERMSESMPNTSVLMLTFDQEDNGTEYFTTEVMEQITKVCPAPVFGVYDTLLGHGIVGGCLVSAEGQGEMAGVMANRILNGEDPADIPVAGLDMSQFVFDANQLRRWSIQKEALPNDAVVRFEQQSVWEKYRGYFITGLSLLILQSVAILGMIINRSRRLNAERSLSVSRDNAKRLAGRLLTAQEDERSRLARELHDDLSQRMAASAIEADKLAQQSDLSPEDQSKLEILTQELISLSNDLHRISRQIHPSILDDLGLPDALQSECDRFAKRESTAIQFRCGSVPEGLPKETSLCLYRIAQESLWNAAKYAQADQVEVLLTADAEAVFLKISDSGIGFDPDGIASNVGLGLASMRERVGLVNGTLTVNSTPGSGTSIAAIIPLVEEKQ